MNSNKALLLTGSERGIFGNKFFKIQSVFSNGRPQTGRPDHFGPLLVFNDDIVSPNGFLDFHPHQNVEVIAIILEGSEFQKDDKGGAVELYQDDIQLISSGTGIQHSAGNPSKTKFARNLQIWFEPREKNAIPNIQTKSGLNIHKHNEWNLQISPDGMNESIKIPQDAWLSKGRFDANSEQRYDLFRKKNGVMIYLIGGKVEINSFILNAQDTLFLYETDTVLLHIIEEAHIQIIEVFAKSV